MTNGEKFDLIYQIELLEKERRQICEKEIKRDPTNKQRYTKELGFMLYAFGLVKQKIETKY